MSSYSNLTDDNGGEGYYIQISRMQCNSTYEAWYNFPAATYGTITMTDNPYDDVASDICPKGWRLPTASEMYDVINGVISRFNPVVGGYYNNGRLEYTDYGYWWSSTVGDPNGRYFMVYGDNQFNANNNYRYVGSFVRCIKS